MARVMKELKKFFKRRSLHESVFSVADEYTYVRGEGRRVIDIGEIVEYESVRILEESRDIEEILPDLDENSYNQVMVNVSTSATSEEDTPSTMLSSDDENQSRNQCSEVDNTYEYLNDDCMRERQIIDDEVAPIKIEFGVEIENPPETNLVLSLDDITLPELPPLLLQNIPPENVATPVNINDQSPYETIDEPRFALTLENYSWNMENDNGTPRIMDSVPQWTNTESMIISNLVNGRLYERIDNEVSHQTLHENVDVDEIEEDDNIAESICVIYEFSESIEVLQQELIIQEQFIEQSTKALEASDLYNFNGSIEEMEASRILLIAETKRNMLQDKIRNIRVDIRGNGVIKFKKFRFSKKTMGFKLANMCCKQKSETCMWFLIIVSTGNVVSTNKVIETSDHLVIEDELVIDGQQINFDVRMYLHYVSLKNEKKKKKKKRGESVDNNWSLAGKFFFDKNNLRASDLVMEDVLETCPLSGTFEVEVEKDVQIDKIFAGFLDIKKHWLGENIWGHSWCIWKDAKLAFFRYPTDEKCFYEIDFKKSKRNNVYKPDRIECPRRKSLVVQTMVEDHAFSDYISADCLLLINTWEHNINEVLEFLKDWY